MGYILLLIGILAPVLFVGFVILAKYYNNEIQLIDEEELKNNKNEN